MTLEDALDKLSGSPDLPDHELANEAWETVTTALVALGGARIHEIAMPRLPAELKARGVHPRIANKILQFLSTDAPRRGCFSKGLKADDLAEYHERCRRRDHAVVMDVIQQLKEILEGRLQGIEQPLTASMTARAVESEGERRIGVREIKRECDGQSLKQRAK